jgi:hypothetical protein
MATTADTSTTGPLPDELAGHRVLSELPAAPGATGPSYLALSPAGRLVVLKALDDDCLHRGQLHPAIKQRLARVRELAHAGVANLHSVEREPGGRPYLVWAFAEGQTFGEFAAANPSPREMWAAGRELILTVEALHALGIVHGAVHGRNVIVAADGRVRLTHVSPLLYTDVAEDELAVMDLLADAAPHDALLADAVAAARAEPRQPLRRLSARLAELLEARGGAVPVADATQDDRRVRGRSVAAAIVTLCVGAALAYGAMRYAGTVRIDTGGAGRGAAVR